MRVFKYIPISLFVLVACIWDIWAPAIKYADMIAPESMVNWCILYYSVVYLSWFIHCVMEAINTDILYFGAVGVGIGIRIYTELSRIGMNYNEYAHSVDDTQARVLLVIWACISLLTALLIPTRHGRIKRMG